MNESQLSKVDNYKEKVKRQAEDLIVIEFPKKILELESLLDTDKFSQKTLSSINSDLKLPVPNPDNSQQNNDTAREPKAKKKKLDSNGSEVMGHPNVDKVPSNTKILEILNLVKPKIKQLVKDSNLLKMWLQFQIPRIEDGNNFGVQELTLREIRSAERMAANDYDHISSYFLNRGKIVAKIAKYPYIDDFRRTVQELDEKEYLSMWLMVCELRNHYAIIHDLITKNMKNIKKPLSSNTKTYY